MAKVRIVATKEDAQAAEKDFGDFVVPKAGWYILTCAAINDGFSKGDDGEPDEDRPRLEVIYAITGEGTEERKPEANYGNVWDYVTFGETAGWKRSQFVKAFGISDTGEFEGDVDTDELINMKVLARLVPEKGQTKDDPGRARVKKLLPYGSSPTSSASINDGSEAEFGGGTEEDTPFDEGTEEETQGYTVDELEALDLKELGGILREWGEDPKALIVNNAKGKLDPDATKEACVNAILEKQGTGDEDTGEDPF